MSKFIKSIVLLLIFVCVFVISACDAAAADPVTAESLLYKSNEAMVEVGENYAIDISMEMITSVSGNVEEADMEIKIPVSIDTDMKFVDEYMHSESKTESSVNALITVGGESQQIDNHETKKTESYTVVANNRARKYIKENEEGWIVVEQTSNIKQLRKFLVSDIFVNAFVNGDFNKSDNGYKVSVPLAFMLNRGELESFLEGVHIKQIEELGLTTLDLALLMKDAIVEYSFDSKFYLTSIKIEGNEIDISDSFVVGDLQGADSVNIDRGTLKVSLKLEFEKFGQINKEDVSVPEIVIDEATPVETISESKLQIEGYEISKPTEIIQPDNKESEDISNDWKDMEIKIDGVLYTFPYDYKHFNSNGWYVDLGGSQYEGMTLKKEESVSKTIDMYHEKYGSDFNNFSMWVGFKNYSSKTANILDCDLWAIELNTISGWDQLENYPEIELAKGIKWGSTIGDIKKAYGQWDNEYTVAEHGCVKVEYLYDYDLSMTLTIFDKYGLAAVEFKGYT